MDTKQTLPSLSPGNEAQATWPGENRGVEESPNAAVRLDAMSYLRECDRRFDAKLNLLAELFDSPGYHTQIANGGVVHGTVQSLRYALALLQSGDESCHERAGAIVHAVLGLQDTNAASPTYGIWPWFLEEPLSEMSPPDWNWADFCGELLALTLADYSGVLPFGLVAEMKAALGHAAWAIFRRNSNPGYTNIAVLGGVVTGAAGELLGEPRLTDYARRRFSRLLAKVERHGDFNEYNSPWYTMLCLRGAESGLHLIRDASLRASIATVWRLIWKTIAEYYHPATDQWAGPHSRTYKDRFPGGVRSTLGDRLGGPRTEAQDGQDFAPTLACPAEFRSRFDRLPAAEFVLSRQFAAETGRTFNISGTTWFRGDACLGSVSRDSFWVQRRPLLGYWRMPERECAVLRCRLLKDGRDFAGCGLTGVQEGPRILGAACAFSNLGDYHLHIDRPTNGRYRIADLRLRFQLAARGATAVERNPECFELQAGGWRVIVHLPQAESGRSHVETGSEGEIAWIDLPLHTGTCREFEPAELPLGGACFALELVGPGDTPAPPPVCTDGIRVAWPGASGIEMEMRQEVVSYPVFYWQPNS